MGCDGMVNRGVRGWVNKTVQVAEARGRESGVMGVGVGGLGPYEVRFNLCGL